LIRTTSWARKTVSKIERRTAAPTSFRPRPRFRLRALSWASQDKSIHRDALVAKRPGLLRLGPVAYGGSGLGLLDTEPLEGAHPGFACSVRS
jgi:hypothetical protein